MGYQDLALANANLATNTAGRLGDILSSSSARQSQLITDRARATATGQLQAGQAMAKLATDLAPSVVSTLGDMQKFEQWHEQAKLKKEAAEDDRVYRAAVAAHPDDPEAAIQVMLKAGRPTPAMAYQKATDASRNAVLDTATKYVAGQKARTEQARRLLASVDPDNLDATYPPVRASILAQIPDPQERAQFAGILPERVDAQQFEFVSRIGGDVDKYWEINQKALEMAVKGDDVGIGMSLASQPDAEHYQHAWNIWSKGWRKEALAKYPPPDQWTVDTPAKIKASMIPPKDQETINATRENREQIQQTRDAAAADLALSRANLQADRLADNARQDARDRAQNAYQMAMLGLAGRREDFKESGTGKADASMPEPVRQYIDNMAAGYSRRTDLGVKTTDLKNFPSGNEPMTPFEAAEAELKKAMPDLLRAHPKLDATKAYTRLDRLFGKRKPADEPQDFAPLPDETSAPAPVSTAPKPATPPPAVKAQAPSGAAASAAPAGKPANKDADDIKEMTENLKSKPEGPYSREDGTFWLKAKDGSVTKTLPWPVPPSVRTLLSGKAPNDYELTDDQVWRVFPNGTMARIK